MTRDLDSLPSTEREAFEAWAIDARFAWRQASTGEFWFYRHGGDGMFEAWQARAALGAEWDAKDTARLDWLMHHLSGKELRRIGIETSSGGPLWTRVAIDAAMGVKP